MSSRSAIILLAFSLLVFRDTVKLPLRFHVLLLHICFIIPLLILFSEHIPRVSTHSYDSVKQN